MRKGVRPGKFFNFSYMLNLGAMCIGVNLYLNDKLRSELNQYEEEGTLKQTLKDIHERSVKDLPRQKRIETRNKINTYRKILLSYCEGNVLETGCGSGNNFEFYKDSVIDKVIAVDYSQSMLDEAKDKLDNPGRWRISTKKITTQLMDCEELKFEDNTFDTVVDTMNMHAYYDPYLVLKNIKRVLKDKGLLIVIARGISDSAPVRDFYKIFRPWTILKYGVDYNTDWDKFFALNEDLEVLYKQRKNYGKTYLYVFRLNKNI